MKLITDKRVLMSIAIVAGLIAATLLWQRSGLRADLGSLADGIAEVVVAAFTGSTIEEISAPRIQADAEARASMTILLVFALPLWAASLFTGVAGVSIWRRDRWLKGRSPGSTLAAILLAWLLPILLVVFAFPAFFDIGFLGPSTRSRSSEAMVWACTYGYLFFAGLQIVGIVIRRLGQGVHGAMIALLVIPHGLFMPFFLLLVLGSCSS